MTDSQIIGPHTTRTRALRCSRRRAHLIQPRRVLLGVELKLRLEGVVHVRWHRAHLHLVLAVRRRRREIQRARLEEQLVLAHLQVVLRLFQPLGRDDGRLDVFVVLAEVLDEVGEIVEAVEVGRA